jgi:hypothetical protein
MTGVGFETKLLSLFFFGKKSVDFARVAKQAKRVM